MKWIGRNKRWISFLLVVILCGGGTFYYLKYVKPDNASASTEVTTTVKKGTIRSSVTGSAQLEPKETKILTSPSDGTIKTIKLQRNMDNVKAGDVLVELTNATLDSNMTKAQTTLASLQKSLDDTQDQIKALTGYAPISGKITLSANLDTGSNVQKNAKIATISDNSKLTATIAFKLEEAANLAVGDAIDLSFDGFLLTKTGTIDSISKEAKPDQKGGKLIEVTVSIVNDSTLDAGMKVSGSIVKNGVTYTSQTKGTLAYAKVVNVLAGAGGTIESLPFATNANVDKGQVIFTIFNDTLKDDLKSKQDSIDQQKLAIQDIQDKLDLLVLKAPFDGTFSTDFVNQRTNILTQFTPGTKVTTSTQFGGMADLKTMMLTLQVDELDMANVKTGMSAEVKSDSIAGRVFQAKVDQVSTVGTTSNGVTTYSVVLSIDNSQGTLKNGMSATGEILFQNKENVLTIPTEFLQRSQGKTFVTLKKDDGTLESQHEVKTGIRSSTQIEITEGLSEGQTVVIPVTPKQQTLNEQDINRLRQQFQGGTQGGQGQLQISPEDAQRLRQQFQQNGGGGNFGGGNAGGGNAGGGNAGGGNAGGGNAGGGAARTGGTTTGGGGR
ncbi:efflux RND transporter periplasmic adaptor subunit [Paenibacillus cymbidii]|uniref:efflux RND transporter periplasmic adaptor subunit n=1 Tax=Paenibacillus cymbidii TaxID=1639034 RepID=UPI001081ACCE|nr:efflux RND transporter periplasmic adaptor subunit [Paenibacillus cymbidii]